MSGLWLAHPEWLTAGAATLAAAAVALGAALLRARRRGRALFGGFDHAGPPGVHTRVWRAGAPRDLALLVALGLVVAALLGPRIQRQSVRVATSGRDVVVLVDVSQSMQARDVPPSRMDRARRAAQGVLAALLPGDRAALAVFAGRGVLLTPLTPDTAALEAMLPALGPGLMNEGGSSVALGIEAAVAAFEEASERARVVFVLSDGESFDAVRDPGARTALRAGARVLAVGLGTESGAQVPDHGGPLRDSSGRAVVTRRRLEPLAQLTKATGGALFIADEWGSFDESSAWRAMGPSLSAAEAATPTDADESAYRLETRIVPAVLPFAAGAFALLLAEALPWRRLGLRRRRFSGAAHAPARPAAAAALVALGLAITTLVAPWVAAGDGDGGRQRELRELRRQLGALPGASAELLVEMGLARARSGDWQQAHHRFLAAALLAPDPELAALAYANLGATALAQGKLEEARDFLFDSLAMYPQSSETRFDLEWTLARIDAQAKEATPEPDEERESPARPRPEPKQEERQSADSPEPATLPEVTDEQNAAAEPGQAEREPTRSPSALPRRRPLSSKERERWMERIEDDPERALRSAAGDTRGAPPEPRGRQPRW